MGCQNKWAPNEVSTKFLPCRQCSFCRLMNRLEWQNRLLAEAATNPIWPLFITMTYAEEPTEDEAIENVKKFWKRMRYYHGRFRYYSVLENGEKKGRLHHHAILWLPKVRECPGGERTIDRKLIREVWGHGYTDTQWVKSPAGLKYVAKYVSKDVVRRQWSQRPGLGRDLEDYWRQRMIRRHQFQHFTKWSQVPVCISRVVLGQPCRIYMGTDALRRLFQELGVSATPDLSLSYKGVPTGPIDHQLFASRITAWPVKNHPQLDVQPESSSQKLLHFHP